MMQWNDGRMKVGTILLQNSMNQGMKLTEECQSEAWNWRIIFITKQMGPIDISN